MDNTSAKKWGLKSTRKKGKYYRKKKGEGLSINGKTLEEVEEFKYLGQVISFPKGDNSELKSRIAYA